MSSSARGIAGSSPLAPYDKDLHVLLKEGIQARWSAMTTPAPDPPANQVLFLDVWPGDYGDLIVACPPGESRPVQRADGWGRIQEVDNLSIHIFIRTIDSGNTPPYSKKMQNVLEDIIDWNPTTIIPYAVVARTSKVFVGKDMDNNISEWHWAYGVSVMYTVVMT